MDNVYLFSLIVGGFFVVLSAFGFGESDNDFDADADVDFDIDADVDLDIDGDVGGDVSADFSSDISGGTGFIDLFSLRALFLFAAFFGFSGVMLNVLGAGAEPINALFSFVIGALAGLGGNYVIKNFAYKSVSSDVTSRQLKGQTAKVLLPFGAEDKGKILVTARGQKHQIVAQSVSDQTQDEFGAGDEVVIVRMNGRIAEVVKPN